MSTMTKNPILNELYDIRAQILAEHGDNLSEYLHDEFERLKAEGHPVAQIKQRRIQRTEAEKPADSPVEEHASSADR